MTNKFAKYKPIYDEFIKLYDFGSEDLPGEVWLPIPCFDKYHASNFGRIKSFKYKEPRIMKPTLSRNGYLYVNLWQGDKHHLAKLTAAQVVYIRDNPDKLSQNALGKKFGVNRATISYIQTGKTYKSVGGFTCAKHDNPLRLPDEIRNEIKSLRAQGMTGKDLAARFKVNIRRIWKILKEQ